MKHDNQNNTKREGFTLVELLIVIGILAVLGTTAVVILNPAEFIARGRDAKRISEINTLDKALSLYETQGGTLQGDDDTIYISLPNTLADCTGTPSYTLPELPTGWSHRCALEADYRKVDGTGWMPNDLTTTPGISISALPIDPTNTDTNQLYYSYIKGSYELTANTESNKHLLDASNDGGDSVSFEAGSNKKLSPVRRTIFDFTEFPTAASGSGEPGWYKVQGGGTASLGSDSGGNYMRTNGYVWYVYQQNIPFNPNVKYKISCRVRQVFASTNNEQHAYCGLEGVASDGTTLLNVNGDNGHNSQHYLAASFNHLTEGAGYTTYTGYVEGNGTPAGGLHQNENDPGEMYPGVTYVRPMFIIGYNGGDGTADIESWSLEVIE